MIVQRHVFIVILKDLCCIVALLGESLGAPLRHAEPVPESASGKLITVRQAANIKIRARKFEQAPDGVCPEYPGVAAADDQDLPTSRRGRPADDEQTEHFA